jgi:hypothetical protein
LAFGLRSSGGFSRVRNRPGKPGEAGLESGARKPAAEAARRPGRPGPAIGENSGKGGDIGALSGDGARVRGRVLCSNPRELRPIPKIAKESSSAAPPRRGVENLGFFRPAPRPHLGAQSKLSFSFGAGDKSELIALGLWRSRFGSLYPAQGVSAGCASCCAGPSEFHPME